MSTSTLSNQPGVESFYPKSVNLDSPFLTHAKTICTISAAAQEYINQKSFPCSVRKGDLLVRAGETSQSLYYLRRGVMRSYVKEGIKDITTWIAGEHEFVACITSLGLQQPAKENLQALEDCELVGFRFDDLQYLYDNFPELNIVGRKVLEKYFRDSEERAFIARLTEATSKYKHFSTTKSDLLNRVPLKFVASYLGMTLETLSRIRSKLSRNANGIVS